MAASYQDHELLASKKVWTLTQSRGGAERGAGLETGDTT